MQQVQAISKPKAMAVIDLTEHADTLIESHARFATGHAGAAPRWLTSLRADAMRQFAESGFPTTKDEAWRFTNVAPIAKTSFALPSAAPSTLKPAELRAIAIPHLTGPQFVFVNGRFEPSLSRIGSLPTNVRIVGLADAIDSDQKLIATHLERHPVQNQDAFTNLNTAFLEDGLFIHVPKGVAVEQPIHLVCMTTSTASPIMTHPRNIFIADEASEFTVIEHYVALNQGVYMTNAVTDVIVGQGANVHHYLLEEETANALNVSTLRVRQDRDSRFTSHTVLLGGKLVRNNVHTILDGEGCDCLINGLYVGSDSQHMDNHMRVEHAKPHGDSRQFYKGILNDKATAVFSGRIIVHIDAQKTDAKQTNKNLLLSDDCHVDTQPQLEIYADDVKCTHGATIGRLDEEAIFYLRARGLSEDAARSLLIHAFAGESLGRMNIEAIRTYLDRILLRRLPGGELLEHML